MGKIDTSDGSNRTIIKNTVVLYLRSFVMMSIGIFTGRILLQALGISDFGLYGAIGSMVTMFTIINGVLSAGSSRFLTYELGRNDPDRLKKTFSASFVMHCAMAFLLLILFETMGLWIVNTKLNIPSGREFAANVVYQFSILTCLMGLTQVPYSAVIIARERFDIFAYVGIGEALFKLFLPLCLVYGRFGDNLIAFSIICAVWTIGLQVFYRVYCYRRYPETRLSFCREKSIYKGMLSYSLWDLLGQFCATGNSQGINLLINVFFGVNLNAAKNVALTVEQKVTQFNDNFVTSALPQITKSYASGDHVRFFELIYEVGKCSFYLLFVLSLPVFLEAEYLLSLWLVEVPPQAVVFLRFIMIGVLLRSPMRPMLTAIHATGDVRFLNLTSGLFAVATVLPGVYFLFSNGCAVWTYFGVTLPVGLICSVLEAYSLKRKVDYSLKHYFAHVHGVLLLIAIASSWPAVLLRLSMESGMIRLILVGLISLFSASVCIWFFGLSASVKTQILSKVKRAVGAV